MLKQLNLKSFKCFHNLKLPLKELTVLSGANASGKSSIIQSLVLLHQTIINNSWSDFLNLNGRLVNLGMVSDVIDNEMSGNLRTLDTPVKDTFEIGIKYNNSEIVWTAGGTEYKKEINAPLLSIRYKHEKDMSYKVESFFSAEAAATKLKTQRQPVLNLLPLSFEDVDARKIQKALRNLNYISSERIGPRETYPTFPEIDGRFVGSLGEYAPGYFERYGGVAPNPGLVVNDKLATTLRAHVNSWMNFFFPGSEFEVTNIDGTNLVKLEVRASSHGCRHRPQNVGFGLTQTFPIVVACMGASSDEIILIENPEVHLHPAAQSKMGYFLALAASTGIQIVLETHSDHILNGIRKAIKFGKLSRKQTAIYHFKPRAPEAGDKERVIVLKVDKNGRINPWPEGFFDQIEKDLDELLGV